METIITIGHYQSKDSLNSEKPDIIRVLGSDRKKEGYWITQDGKSIPSYELENNWIKLYTSASKVEAKQLPMNLFAGIDDNSDYEEIQEKEVNLSNPEASITIQHKIEEKKIIPKQIPFDITIIEKINIDFLNKKAFDNFGIENKIKKQTLNINLPIEFNYDIEKLRQTIELLSLDENIIIDFLIESISIIEIKKLLKERLRKNLFDKIIKTNEVIQKVNSEIIKTEPIIEKTYIEPVKIEKIINNNNEILEGISEIEKYLKNLI